MNVKIITPLMTVAACTISVTAHSTQPTDSLTRQLQEIVVTANLPATKLVGTTLVSTITGTTLAGLGNALDVLAQLPMINVTDNTVCITGKSNVRIMIDGRPMREETELQQLLSSNIRKVELLMAPGAAYESTTDAVLRITTRHNFTQGLSLTDRVTLQRRRRWSIAEDLSLNYRTGDWDIYLDGTFSHDDKIITGLTTNTLLHDGKETVVGSSQHNRYPSNSGVIRGGMNYAKGNRCFGTYYCYNPQKSSLYNSGSELIDNSTPLSRDIYKSARSHSHLVSAYYENSVDGRYLIHFDGNFRHSMTDNSVSTSYPASDIEAVNSTDIRKSTLWAGKLYVDFPFLNGDFTIGTQDSHTRTTLDYRMLNATVGQYIPSSLTDAGQTSAALFASWSYMTDRFRLTAGARYEYVDYIFKVNGIRDDDMSRRSHLLTPDISLGYSFNDRSQLSLSYKMAKVKPPYSHLTGSLSYTGLHEIEGGNPALRDEHMHDLQLMAMHDDFMLQADITRSIDSYAFVKQVYPADNLQLLMHPVNIDVTAFSMYLVWGKRIGCWTPNATLGLYRQWLDIAGTSYDRPIFSYDINNTFALPRGWSATVNIGGRSRGDMHTNQFGSTWLTADLSVGKTFLNKSLNVRLTATDIFNTANNDWTMNTYGVFVDKRQKYDRRGVTLNIIYQFNPRKNKYKGKTADESEMKRL